MSEEFVRVGPLKEIGSYPIWARELLRLCEESKSQVVEHELFRKMRDGELDTGTLHHFLIGVWPVIEQFPQYMALNLLKIRYGRTRGQDLARRYLVRNIRVEQSHAEHWVEWALASGVTREDLMFSPVPVPMLALCHWCWHTCDRDTLVLGMAATNFAIEGATGEWAVKVCSRDVYEQSFPPEQRVRAMKWLRLHAQYDDAHPWEALEIICTLLGNNPTERDFAHLHAVICNSYDYMRMTLDYCLDASVLPPPHEARFDGEALLPRLKGRFAYLG
jgi:pyrroloquinoline quinone (PQQ) biosynthesis protein C